MKKITKRLKINRAIFFIFMFVLAACGSSSSDDQAPANPIPATYNFAVGIISDGTSIFVTDGSDHTIRQINIATSVVTTLAGTALASGSTDATGEAARFNNPYSITTDGTNLYVTDSGNNTIRQVVIATGVVTTVAGTAGMSGSANGTGADARFNFPSGITTDDGTNLYVSDSVNHTIRKIVVATGAVTTLAGTAGMDEATDATGVAARFFRPVGIIVNDANLFVADQNNSTIRKVVIATGEVTTFAGMALVEGSTDATGTAARFNIPSGITTDGTNLYVVDNNNYTIRQIVIASGVVTTLAGTALSSARTDGIGAAARFGSPRNITIAGGNLYITDKFVRKLTISTAEVITLTGPEG